MRSGPLATLIALCAGVLPAAVALWMLVHHWVPVPYADEWKTPGEQIVSYYRGTLTLEELCSQHNESRKLFPRLVYLAVAIATHWDVRIIMALSFALVCGGSVLLYLLARRCCGSPLASACCFAAMNVWLFWPRQYETFVLSIQGELFVPPFALAAACLVNLSRRPTWWKAGVNATLAHVSTYTVANGMLVWPLAFPIVSAKAQAGAETNPGGRQLWPRLAYLAAATASIGCYFYGYQHPPLAPPMVLSVERWPELAAFVGRWLGDLTLVGAPLVAGTLIALLFTLLAATAIWRCRVNGEWRQHYPFLVLGLYTIVSGCVAAVGRLAFGPEAAMHSRYAPYTAFLYIAAAGLLGSIHGQIRSRKVATLWRAACAIAAVTVLVMGVSAFAKERSLLAETTADRRHLLQVVRWSKAIPANPDLRHLSPYENTTAVIRELDQLGVLYPPLVDEQLASAVSRPPVDAATTAGALERVALASSAAELLIEGWAQTPEGGVPADCAVIGYETAGAEWKPFTVIETGAKRQDVAARFGSDQLLRAGFKGRVLTAGLPPGELTFRAWSVALDARRAAPLHGAPALEFPPAD
ncbi:MAG: hypothetical protein AVDCRST_MAG42-2600 [uncultured Chthoniobacterales bacterium]|uniref:Transmembrane protein n=1 Tax=uncultured Chthoniobacterales bacterium TaxID=1836801 RepID=A0A6J4IPU3_9BACT|nr:MAG: hypothetical protein AVDCRST_MAG42-2600 [uncultured Chthoniobacterales bacterium]